MRPLKGCLFLLFIAFFCITAHSFAYFLPAGTISGQKHQQHEKKTPHPWKKWTMQHSKHLQGKPPRAVAQAVVISHQSAIGIRNNIKENIPDPHPGRPRKITERTAAVLARHYDTGDLITYKDEQRFIQSTKRKQRCHCPAPSTSEGRLDMFAAHETQTHKGIRSLMAQRL